MKNGNYKHRKFGNAIKKYGWENFDHIILEEAEIAEEADALERKYIEEYDSLNNGYNCTSGGNSKKVISEETKKRISESHKKENLSEDALKRYSECKKGLSATKGKHYEKMSESKMRRKESYAWKRSVE